MNPDDVINAAPAIAKGAAALGAAIPFTSIMKRMLGPATDEVAEMLRDQVRVYRYGRQIKLLEKAETMAKDAGFTPQPVAPKILFPLLEGASFEENEDLHTMWAALLANAASPENAGKIRPGFIATLKNLARDEAALLNWMFEQRTPHYAGPFTMEFRYDELINAYIKLGFAIPGGPDHNVLDVDRFAFESCAQSLDAEGLIRFRGLGSLTTRGLLFVEACQPPRPKA